MLVENINPFLWVTVMNVSKSLIKSTLSALCKLPLRILNKMHGHSCSSLGIGCLPSPHRNPFHCGLLCALESLPHAELRVASCPPAHQSSPSSLTSLPQINPTQLQVTASKELKTTLQAS